MSDPPNPLLDVVFDHGSVASAPAGVARRKRLGEQHAVDHDDEPENDERERDRTDQDQLGSVAPVIIPNITV
ncbi:hypothetical protein NP511_03960 [Natrinema thermotolerans]|uniref:Uncharacterized protein n=1 Tax=Natrinema thermotolerans TaxID=121872 RepID=A0AAF0T230_9EURY|nr:hypothetical protein [Natrinema thermotolerans]WMT08790.1 hypothetical protein NP511_03960 [Natrinema thermotolerans]